MRVYDTRDKTIPKDDAIILQAKKRLKILEDYDRDTRKQAIEDLKMLIGEDHWPSEIVAKRELEKRPVLTINKLPAFLDRVTNEGRLNKLSIKVRPYGGGATKEMAETFSGIIRNIENESDAEVAYQTALDCSAGCGFGYIGVTTEYSDDTTFDQDIRIREFDDPLTVFLDYHNPPRFGFVIETIDRDEYKARFPGKSPPQGIDTEHGWVGENEVRIAEYWTLEPVKKRLYLLSDGRTVDGDEWDSIKDELSSMERTVHVEPGPDGSPVEVDGPAPEGSGFPEMVRNKVPEVIREREVQSHKVVQYLIDGEKIIESHDWAGSRIPIVMVPGKKNVVGGKRILRGVIRFAKDPQRMYNYFRTAATETVALAPKAPYIMEEGQIEGHEDEWAMVGNSNLPYLLYKGKPGVPPPQRQVVEKTAIAEITEANLANDEMKATTSLFDASLGARGNEVSGIAISARQSQGDIANLTYFDNLRRAVKTIGNILVDLIPKIYDTERQLVVVHEDETEEVVTVNQQAGNTVINDLTQGRYRVTVTAGPSFSTQRMEAAQSMLDFIRVAPGVASTIIDLVAENMDWPGAEKIAKRFRTQLGVDEDGNIRPPSPSVDDIIKKLKAEGIAIGNEKRKLDVVEKRRDLAGTLEEVARAGAAGAIKTFLGGGDNIEGGAEGR